jgi:hypothetical protein
MIILGKTYNSTVIFPQYGQTLLIPVVVRSKAWVCSLLAEIAGSNPAGCMDVSVVCCQVQVPESG